MRRLTGISRLQLLMSAVLVVVIAASGRADEPAHRIASLGGGITEIVYALGEEHRLVARDTTSNHPQPALDLPNVGYIRALSAEGILSVNPDLIIAKEGAGPLETVELLESASIPIVWVPDGFTKDAVLEKIKVVANALGVPTKGDHLVTDVSEKIDAAVQATNTDHQPNVLFILSMTGGRIMAAGSQTSADGIITLAGGTNATSVFEGWKPLTDEAVISSQPDVILLMAREGDAAITDEQLFSHPAIAATPAGQNRAVVRLDGMLMTGFSVRTAEAIEKLSAALKETGS
ncbi:hemin ABC transporter substrate-binding protein [Shimia sp. NS0008-38b]|uniref:heme/hemin ABC transporter substrate-binding protein n=1 Tax=Shimia sp. NS0008-38b TaxID=3127653 RepID=UPI003102B915